MINEIEDTFSELLDYFENSENLNIITELQLLGLNMKYISSEIERVQVFADMTFVVTGTLSKTRDYYKRIITESGGKVTGSVSKKTSYVLVGDNPGSKYQKAMDLGVEILTENEFEELVK